MSANLISSEMPTKRQEEFGLYFRVGSPNPGGDEKVYFLANAAKPRLTEELARMVPAALGSTYLLQRIEVWRGSARIVVYLTGSLTALSHYPDLLRSLESLMRQIEGLLRETFEGAGFPGVSIASGWTNLTTRHPRQFWRFRAYQSLLRMTLASLLIFGTALLLLLFLGRVIGVLARR